MHCADNMNFITPITHQKHEMHETHEYQVNTNCIIVIEVQISTERLV